MTDTNRDDSEVQTPGPQKSDTGNIRVKVLQRQSIISRFHSYREDLTQFSLMSHQQLEVKLSLLERHFNTFEEIQSHLEMLDESQFDENHRTETENAYFELKSQILEHIEAHRVNNSDTVLTSTRVVTQANSSSQRVHLPSLQLSKFSGEHRDWLDFYNTFCAMVHNNADLSSISKFQYLRSCLTGSAARLIHSLEVTPDNYEKALGVLTSRFDNKRYIFQSHMQHIFDVQRINKQSVSSLRDFIDDINANLRALESISSQNDIANGILLHMIVSKLDVETQSKWEEEISVHYDQSISSSTLNLPKWENLASFLERRCKMMDIIETNCSSSKNQTQYSSTNRVHQSKNRSASSFVASKEDTMCKFCDTAPSHSVFRCPKFVEMSVSDRFKTVKRLHLCLNCMGSNHVANNCPSLNRCQHCRASHHTLLHKAPSQISSPTPDRPKNSSNIASASSTITASPTESAVVLQATQERGQVLLGTARVRLCTSAGINIICRAMLDSGSQIHFITERMAQYLRVQRNKSNLKICGIGINTTNTYHSCSLTIKSLVNGFATTINAVILPSITSYQPQHSINIKEWCIPQNITLADSTFYQSGPIDVLIGAELFYDLLLIGQIKSESCPILQKTHFGWIVSGTTKGLANSEPHTLLSSKAALLYPKVVSTSFTTPNTSTPTRTSLHIAEISSNDNDKFLEYILEKFWTLEDISLNSTKQLSAEELECERFFSETTKKCPETGRFIVRLPFKANPSLLGDSFEIARKRFHYLEKKFARDIAIFKEYKDFIQEYESLGHMGRTSSNDHSRYNLIPHHCVLKPESSTTRLRVVFDASCRTSNGTSINDILRVGPTLQDDIFTILSRFRYHMYVLVADITKMYRQVLVDPRDSVHQCILWRNNTHEALATYQLQTITYGTSCAPYLAVKCLQQLAHDQSKEFPIGAAVTVKDFYVDNLMTGGSTIEEVREIKHQVCELLKRGGFPLRKFASNCEAVISDVSQSERENITIVDDMEYVKTLGLKWSPTEDVFSFAYTHQSKSMKVTKRSVLAHMASVYDPLGLINPIIIRCKILFQALWTLKLHWDESVPHDIYLQWEQISNQFELITEIKIPRFISFNAMTNFHAFSDASTKAFGACVYAVTFSSIGVKSSLLCAKSRVAPIKNVSLPRLELCAAVLLCNLLDIALKCCPTQPQHIYCWSDSTITLAWIKGDPSRWTKFVANRVAKIQQCTSHATWLHVPSQQNPADLLSRGTTVSSLTNSSLWLSGPQFLVLGKEHWPSQQLTALDQLCEVRKQTTSLMVTQTEDIIIHHKFINKYEKLSRIFAYVNRFISIMRQKASDVGPITVIEMHKGLAIVCSIIQRSAFSLELRNLKEEKPIHRKSKLRQLSPFLHDGLMRVGGRLVNSTLPFEVRHPILLPGSHPFVRTMIRHFHHRNLHAGALTLHNIIRDQFWITNARNTIKQVIYKCIMCYKCRPTTETQVMGSLPSDRVKPSFPFEISGVDYCGPFSITQKIRGRPPLKMYIAVFICFSTKAVHLELVPGLTTMAFISALKRFIARRGRCSTIYSDNATNFVGANRELRDLLKSFLTEHHIERVREACNQEGISWKFIPPRSPHFGGLWESAVKQAKHYLRRSIGVHVLTQDEFHTIICQAEAIINSRPLTPLSSDPNDLFSLTPAHFLVGRNLTSLPEPSLTNISPTSLKRFQLIQWMQQHFWNRWQKEYLKTLQQKTKWTSERANIQINDLVLLQDENTPPLKWPLGRVIETSTGSDGRVRVVVVKTAEGTFKRAVAKICRLPIDSQE